MHDGTYPYVNILHEFVHVFVVDGSGFIPEVVSHGQHDVIGCVVGRL